MSKLIEKQCIVCEEPILWPSNSPVPPACRHHTYGDVGKAWDKTDDKEKVEK